MPEVPYDSPFMARRPGPALFGATGGVMAAVRNDARGDGVDDRPGARPSRPCAAMDGIKEAEVELPASVRCGSRSCMVLRTKTVVEAVKRGESAGTSSK